MRQPRNKIGQWIKRPIGIRNKKLTNILLAEIAIFFAIFFLLADHAFGFVAEKIYPEPPMPTIEPKTPPEPILSVREYVFNEVKKEFGLEEAIIASVIVDCESSWQEDICIIEPNNTISCGLWMINTVHNRKDSSNYISNADKLNYKKATEWAIQKRIKDGDWSAWTCGKKKYEKM